jgi:hypothetical protein
MCVCVCVSVCVCVCVCVRVCMCVCVSRGIDLQPSFMFVNVVGVFEQDASTLGDSHACVA